MFPNLFSMLWVEYVKMSKPFRTASPSLQLYPAYVVKVIWNCISFPSQGPRHMKRSTLSFSTRSWKPRHGRWLMLCCAEKDRAIRLRCYEMISRQLAIHCNAKTVVQPVKLSIVSLITSAYYLLPFILFQSHLNTLTTGFTVVNLTEFASAVKKKR
jgi:hypothetical protein